VQAQELCAARAAKVVSLEARLEAKNAIVMQQRSVPPSVRCACPWLTRHRSATVGLLKEKADRLDHTRVQLETDLRVSQDVAERAKAARAASEAKLLELLDESVAIHTENAALLVDNDALQTENADLCSALLAVAREARRRLSARCACDVPSAPQALMSTPAWLETSAVKVSTLVSVCVYNLTDSCARSRSSSPPRLCARPPPTFRHRSPRRPTRPRHLQARPVGPRGFSLFSDFPDDDDDDDFSCDSDAYSFFDGSLAAASPPTSAVSSPAAASWPRGESSGLPTSATFGITAADSVASIAQAFFLGLHPSSSTPSRAAATRGSRLGRDFVCAHKENSFGLRLICVKD
jgi:hypothetical protein